MSRILLIGAKGFAKELLETVVQIEPETKVTFFDDVSSDLPERLFGKYPIIRDDSEVNRYLQTVDNRFVLGVGDPKLRRHFFDKFSSLGGEPLTLVSPFAKIGKFANKIGNGVCILTDAVVESNNQIGDGCLIHVGALISHDVSIGDFCEVSPRASLLGGVKIGADCRIGTGSVILPKITLGSSVTVGAGAVVTKNITDGETVAGVPARPL